MVRAKLRGARVTSDFSDRLAEKIPRVLREPETFVIPAKAGIERLTERERHWNPAFAGMTNRWREFAGKDRAFGSCVAFLSAISRFSGQQWAFAGLRGVYPFRPSARYRINLL